MTTHYVTDGAACVTIAPNGARRGNGWLLTRSWRPEAHDVIWVGTKREAEGIAKEYLQLRRATVSAVRSRVLSALADDAAGVSAEAVERLVAEFSK